MPHGLLKDFKSILATFSAIQLGQLKAFAISYADKKIFEYLEYLKQQCPPPELLAKIGKEIEKIKKLMDAFDKKVNLVSKLPRTLDPAITAGKVIVELLSHIPLPSTIGLPPGPFGGVIISIPTGVIQGLSNLLVFLRKMIETLETDIKAVLSLVTQARGIFDPIRSRLSTVESILKRCAETPKRFGGSGETWGRLVGSRLESNSFVSGGLLVQTNEIVPIPVSELLAGLNLSGSNSFTPGSVSPGQPGTISVGEGRTIITSLYEGQFTPNVYPTLQSIARNNTGADSTSQLSNSSKNTVTLISEDGSSSTLNAADQVIRTKGSSTPSQNSGTTQGTFIANNQSTTGGLGVNSNERSQTDSTNTGITSKGSLIPGTGNTSLDRNIPGNNTTRGLDPAPPKAYIDGVEVGFTEDERLALIANAQGRTTVAPFKDVMYKAANGQTYTLSIIVDDTVNYIAPLRYAVARDFRGIVVLQGPKSFASSQQVLIDELKFRIDNQLP